MSFPEESFISAMNAGTLLIGLYGQDTRLSVGAFVDPNLSIEMQDMAIPNRTTPGGGNAESMSRAGSVSLSCTLYNYSATMLARLLSGTLSTQNAAALPAKLYTVGASGMVFLDAGFVDLAAAVTVSTPDSLTDYTVEEDYKISKMGIEIVPGGAIAAAATADPSGTVQIKITASAIAQRVIQLLRSNDQEFSAVFIEYNEAQNDIVSRLDLFRVKIRLNGDLPLHDPDDYKQLPVILSVIKDTSRDYNGGLSQFMTYYREGLADG